MQVTGNVWNFRPFAQALAQTLEQSGVAEASLDQVSLTLEKLTQQGITDQRVNILQELLGSTGMTRGTYVQVSKSLQKALDWRPSLPGSGQPDSRKECLRLLGALTAPPTATFTTPGQLQALGYAEGVAQRLLDDQPELVADLARWRVADPGQAKARDLYRAMAIPGGLAGYDPDRVGTGNGEMFFGATEDVALGFGKDRLRAHPDWPGVLLHCQFPAFMVESSPPQGGDAVWPILRASSMPDPNHPDIRPFVADLKEFYFDPNDKSRMF